MRINVGDYREAARRKIPRFVFDYVDGAAGDELCMARNVSDLQGLQLLPRALRDTAEVDTSVEVFGQRWRAPLGVAPLGMTGLVRPGGDVMMAQAAAEAGVPYVLSTASNSRLEAVAAAMPAGVRWMQLYVMHDRRMAEHIARRARAANFGALVLTVDVAVGGNRERDVRHGFRLPLKPGTAMALDVVRRPGWLGRLLRDGSPRFVNLAEREDDSTSAQVQALLLARAMDRKLTWESLEWLRACWDGPLLIKGLLHPEDAKEALRRGVDGVVVSNHGGRQLDAAPSPIAMLPRVLDAVGGRIPVFADSGFRRGTDVVKALALGARAVFVGRPPLYGLAADGRRGAHAVLQMLCTEVEHTLILMGATSPRDLSSDQVLPAVAGRLS